MRLSLLIGDLNSIIILTGALLSPDPMNASMLKSHVTRSTIHLSNPLCPLTKICGYDGSSMLSPTTCLSVRPTIMQSAKSVLHHC